MSRAKTAFLVTICILFVGLGIAQLRKPRTVTAATALAAPEMPIATKEQREEYRILLASLADTAERYECPTPAHDADLVLGFTGSVTALPGEKKSGIYRPAMLNGAQTSKTATVLMGFTATKCKGRLITPATRAFTLQEQEGIVIQDNELSTFETCIQLAMLDRMDEAVNIWHVLGSKHDSLGADHDRICFSLADPNYLLAISIFKHLERKSQQPTRDLQKLTAHAKTLKREFPSLFLEDEHYFFEAQRRQFVDDLQATVAADTPEPGSIEEWLMKCATSSGKFPSFYYYEPKDPVSEACHQIHEQGIGAIKPLIDLIPDRRLTVHVREAFMNAGSYQYRVGDLAVSILRGISGAIGPHQNQDHNLRRADIYWNEWAKVTDLSDEIQFLRAAAITPKTGEAHPVPIRILGMKHPTALKQLALTFCKCANGDTQCRFLTDAIGKSSLSTTEKTELLQTMLKRLPQSNNLCALEAIASIDEELAINLTLARLESITADAISQQWNHNNSTLTSVVVKLDDFWTWRTYTQSAKKMAVRSRLAMMDQVDYACSWRQDQDYRIAFLREFLDDKDVRTLDSHEQFNLWEPLSGSSFTTISVRNFAAMKFANLLRLKPQPDSSWDQRQWTDLRSQIKAELDRMDLPDLGS